MSEVNKVDVQAKVAEEKSAMLSINRILKFTAEGQTFSGKYIGTFATKYVDDQTGEIRHTLMHVFSRVDGIYRLSNSLELEILHMLPKGSIISITFLGERESANDPTRNVKLYDIKASVTETQNIVDSMVG